MGKKDLMLILSFLYIQLFYSQTIPTGIYVSAGPTSTTRSSINETIASYPFVEGILVRVDWKYLEPTDDNFDWSLIENQIELANTYQKKISLAVGIGSNAPDWLFDKAQSTTYDFNGSTGEIIVPWDPIFQTEWKEFIEQFGNHFNGNQTISLVYITNASFNGFEMQLPTNVTPTWSSLGYTEEKMIDSWKSAIDAFHLSFPNHYLSNDFHPILESDTPSQSIYNYAKQKIGNKYGASAWWWTKNNTTIYPVQYEILQNSADNSFATIQVAKSGTNDAEKLGDGGLEGTLELAIENNICYWEIWEIDIKNSSYESYFNTLNCNLLETDETNSKENIYAIYPNPFKEKFYIKNLKGNELLEIYNLLGQKINNAKNQNELNLVHYKSGIYFLKITGELNTKTYKLIKE